MSSSPEKKGSSNFPIKTIVVLVQENRSFDHMLGWMKSLNPEIDGVTGTEWNPVSTTDPDSRRVVFGDRSEYVDPDPGHSFQAIYEQVFGEKPNPAGDGAGKVPTMNGFAQQAEGQQKGLSETVMNGFRPDSVPVYKTLVSEFAVFDRWFASLPTSTQPNRLYVHSATSHGLISNDTKKLIPGLPQKTIFESLDEAGFSFGIYFQYPPATLLFRNLRKLKYIGKFHDFDLSFKRHCEEGKLPNYVVVEQRYFDTKILPGNDDHPSHDVSEGQKFVKQVYETLRASPQWEEILFIVTYDEHGGFYDHVPTPADGVPSPDDIVGPPPYNFRFDRLGVRVPAIMISPWIEPGTVVHRASGPHPSSEYEHSSIPATVKKIFNLRDFLTKRDAWAGTFETVINRQTPRTDCPLTLPEPKRLRATDANEDSKLSEFQQELVQIAAALNGDHKKDIYPEKLVESMTVGEASNYVKEALNTFLRACEDGKRNGLDESEIVDVAEKEQQQSTSSDQKLPQPKKKKSFANKMLLACCVCVNQ
ncbi:hypothetical protein H6P81_007364 [Aristolochia fimbriata]|uniref:Uncharacterized protein n=1 Tax=Aristolochia fimbriata TaxID=158543 RepID=A0AAV7EZZ7_ARIFI|nr:hypothetical protein H6P81_007364 [Aristolochia fimbriata]